MVINSIATSLRVSYSSAAEIFLDLAEICRFFLFATFSAIEIQQRFTVFTISPH